MKRYHLIITIFLILTATEAWACPGCTVRAFMPFWPCFLVLRLWAIRLIGNAVLKPIRLLGVFFVYEVLYFFIWIFLIYSGLPILLVVFYIGVPSALLLKCIGRFCWFRKNEDQGVSWKRAVSVIPVMFLIAWAEIWTSSFCSYP
jgi:hypothetical protein